MPNIKEKYSELAKNYSLPGFDEINREFDIEELNAESDLILQKVRLRIYDKLEFYAKLLESMLQPDSSLADMYEAHYIRDEDKNSAYSIFKRLMRILRGSTLVSVNNREEESARLISEAFSEWQSLKPGIEKHLKRVLSLWEKETDIKEDLSYFG